MNILSPPIPHVPACWSWGLPPLPQPSNIFALLQWQEDRCAVCAAHMPGEGLETRLHEDHDHDTGDTRGFLCPRCNVDEGRNRHPVFALYRERPPAVILGVLVRYGCTVHPITHTARVEWERALSEVKERIDRAEHPSRWDLPPLPSSLADAAERVGHRMDENRYRPGWWLRAS